MSKAYQNILSKTDFTPNKDWLQIKTIDMHTHIVPTAYSLIFSMRVD